MSPIIYQDNESGLVYLAPKPSPNSIIYCAFTSGISFTLLYNYPMSTPRSEFIAGSKAILPILIGVLPFALIAGVTAVSVGMTEVQGVGMSFIVYAGAAQLVAMQLIGLTTPIPIIWLSTLFINMRFLMYSISIGPHWEKMTMRWKIPMAFLLTDQAYAVSILHYDEHPQGKNRRWFYLGAAVPFWIMWQTGTAVGVFIGVLVPASWQLDFAIPLTFLALMLATIKDWSMVAAAIGAGIMVIISQPLPYNLGLLLAAIVGIGIGILTQPYFAPRQNSNNP